MAAAAPSEGEPIIVCLRPCLCFVSESMSLCLRLYFCGSLHGCARACVRAADRWTGGCTDGWRGGWSKARHWID